MSNVQPSESALPAPSPELIRDLLARVPEGFVAASLLTTAYGEKSVKQAQTLGYVGSTPGFVFDGARLTSQDVATRKTALRPQLPDHGALQGPSVQEQLMARDEQVPNEPALSAALLYLARGNGYIFRAKIRPMMTDEAVQTLLDRQVLMQTDGLVYDPLRVGQGSLEQVLTRFHQDHLHHTLMEWLSNLPGQTSWREAFFNRAGSPAVAQAILKTGRLVEFTVDGTQWVRPRHAPPEPALVAARAELEAQEEPKWEACLPACGDVVRLGAHEGGSARQRVVARTYLLDTAARRLALSLPALEGAIQHQVLAAFIDPEQRQRLSAAAIESAARDEARWELVAGWETVRTADLALIGEVPYGTVRGWLKQAGLSRTQPNWGDVRGQWGLPGTLRQFRKLLATRQAAVAADQTARTDARRQEKAERVRAARTAARRERDELREKLLAVFPTWETIARDRQAITLHVGPTNSGKTFDALEKLAEAGSGWYLAPLRLLAFETFETLNARGVPCNLLTGEESISVAGAQITASTIEMFAPRSGDACVIIDEAHMLADKQRGWAWTRALMEAQAPEIHVIGAPSAEDLVVRLAEAAGLAIEVAPHDRLTPLDVAPRPWALDKLPSRTILVAFSRQMVLGLKTELELTHHRRVSIVYGALPPEVRRRQAARFAAGDTEICVATDAVGMGLNLPADHVCFFEMEKFDGGQHRPLTDNEIHQIGGRAGRFGLSQAGQVGALTRADLQAVRQAYGRAAEEVAHARVAPSAEALALIPGSLPDKLQRWMELASIPDIWRQLLRPVDLADQIELAGVLSPAEVDALGLERALELINAPTFRDTRPYWTLCARALITRRSMPLPPNPPRAITNSRTLEAFEISIRSADCYLWLSQRREFSGSAPAVETVWARRAAWSQEVDAALQRQVDTARRCGHCGRRLSLTHRYNICDSCFSGRQDHYYQDPNRI